MGIFKLDARFAELDAGAILRLPGAAGVTSAGALGDARFAELEASTEPFSKENDMVPPAAACDHLPMKGGT